MTLKEIVECVHAATPERQDYSVVLAVRENKDEDVALSPVGDARTDEEEAQFWPQSLVRADGRAITNASDLANWAESEPQALICYAIHSLVELGNGDTATLNMPVVAVVWFDDRQELWLVEGPEDVWPAAWFE